MRFWGAMFSVLVAEFSGFLGYSLAMSLPKDPAVLQLLSSEILKFNIVFAILYLLAGVASYLVWEGDEGSFDGPSLYLYAGTLILGLFWFFVFWGVNRPVESLYIAGFMLLSALLTNIFFFVENKTSGFLFLPYLIWITFVFAQNLSVAINYVKFLG